MGNRPPLRQLHLNVNMQTAGRHDAAWLLHEDPLEFLSIDYFRNIARIAERGTFDALFLADHPALDDDPSAGPWNALEPTVLLAGIAATTERLGLMATASTTFNDPYNLARRFATLDHVTRGRVAWNIVTTRTAATAANFGSDGIPDKAERYARAEEFVDVVLKLWDSWEEAAIVGDRATRVFADRGKVHTIDHLGPWFSVRGPLNVPRTPQGRPVLVQAGASEGGRRLASRFADAVFTMQTTLPDAQHFYAEMKRDAALLGRDRDQIVILPGLYPVIGSTEREARQRKAEMDAFLDLENELRKFAERLTVAAERLDLDKVISPDLLLDAENGAASRGILEAAVNLSQRQNLTVRQILELNPARHRMVIGTPEQIADDIEVWFTSRAADGFNLSIDSFPSGLELFVDHVVPELRRRSIFRAEYSGAQLRDHLGLARPRSRYETGHSIATGANLAGPVVTTD
jgi:FMN-dependent oxidoreductase (nitrilotriacetate monooxygenase family)